MLFPRRKFLALIGGGAVVAATGFLTSRTPNTALRPWETAGQYNDLRMRALSYAMLAPNPHNRQPWVADLALKDRVVLYRDQARNLPATDPMDRQMTIGMGCFIELLVQAAAQEGGAVELDLFPEGEAAEAPIANAHFTGKATADPLFASVLARHTNRLPYELNKPVSNRNLEQISSTTVAGVVVASDGGTKVGAIQDIANIAVEVEAQTPRTHAESIHLTRIGKSEIEANPDGISLGGPLMDTLGAIGILTRAAAIDPASTTFAEAIKFQQNAINATPAFFWLITQGNTRRDQIAAGRAWVRAHLKATALGLSVQPISQALQEYPEMAGLYQEIHGTLAPNGGTVQMLGRLGVAPAQNPAPRWPLETRLRNA